MLTSSFTYAMASLALKYDSRPGRLLVWLGATLLLGLLFLGFIFFPVLGFGPARYMGPAGGSPLVPSPVGV